MSSIVACRMCEGPVREVLDLGVMPFSGIFPRPGDPVPTGRLALSLCEGTCGLVQLSDSFDLKVLYGPTYGYRSGLNKSMVEHLTGKAAWLSTYANLQPDDTILDIGSSDGTLLGAYPTSCRRIGVDPSSAKFSSYYPKDVTYIADFFPTDALHDELAGTQPKVITTIAMFYDLEHPLEFAYHIKRLLHPDGIWHTEQSYLPGMLAANAYDTICHEHLEYYSLAQIKYIADATGFKIIDVQFNKVNGGSFNVTLAHTDSRYEEWPGLDAQLRTEQSLGLRDATTYTIFHSHINRQRDRLIHTLRSLPKRAWGFGASTKGNVLLHYSGIDRGLLEGIYDINPDKEGCVTATGIPIYADAPDDVSFLVLPWHFRDGILERYKGTGRQFIFPLPNVEVVNA